MADSHADILDDLVAGVRHSFLEDRTILSFNEYFGQVIDDPKQSLRYYLYCITASQKVGDAERAVAEVRANLRKDAPQIGEILRRDRLQKVRRRGVLPRRVRLSPDGAFPLNDASQRARGPVDGGVDVPQLPQQQFRRFILGERSEAGARFGGPLRVRAAEEVLRLPPLAQRPFGGIAAQGLFDGVEHVEREAGAGAQRRELLFGQIGDLAVEQRFGIAWRGVQEVDLADAGFVPCRPILTVVVQTIVALEVRRSGRWLVQVIQPAHRLGRE